MSAVFNLTAQLKEQLAQAHQFEAEALMALGKADLTMHEPGDQFCQERLNTVRRNLERASRCYLRASTITRQIIDLRPLRSPNRATADSGPVASPSIPRLVHTSSQPDGHPPRPSPDPEAA